MASRLADARFMARALVLARRGKTTTSPNPAVGCVLVRDGEIVAEGWHQRAGEAHAEINALAQVQNEAAGCTAYVTLEPCVHQGKTGPCSQALIDAGVHRVVAAMLDPNPQVAGKGLAQLQASGIDAEAGLLEADARMLNPGFCQRMTTGMPYVTLKLGMSLDGRTAAADGTSQWITGSAARTDVQHLRARSCAVVTGIETVLADDPQLNVRLPNAERQPLRVVLDSHLRTPPTATILQGDGDCLILTTQAAEAERRADLQSAGAEVEDMGCSARVDLKLALQALAESGCNEVMIEAGATLAGAFMEAGLVDELWLYQAPDLLGSAGRGLVDLPSLMTLNQRRAWQQADRRQVGRDQRMILRPAAA